MARYRSRRSSRRSASQSAANLLALALPAPIQRVADTRLGPLLMLVGVPSMLVAGLLQVNWNNGLPTVAVDPQAAATVLQRAGEEYNNLEQQGGLGQLASDIIGGISNHSLQDNYGQSYPTTQQLPQTRVPSANFPSTQPQSSSNHYTSTHGSKFQSSDPSSLPWGQSSYPQQPTQQPPYSQQHYPQQPTYSQPSTHTPQPTYAQPPTYSQSGYQTQAASPSDNRNLTQQQLYQQQQYQQQQYQQQQYQQQQYQLQQQQLYEQQLRDQQYRQWLAQQQHSSTQLPSAQQRSSTGYQQQYDAYGRAVSTGYPQPTNTYTQPTTQHGQQNYNQGYLPNVNPNGRF